MQRLKVKTSQEKQVLDITNEINEALKVQDKTEGQVSIFTTHTTCAVTTADLDPGTDMDFLDFLEKITPQISYRHPHDPKHAPDHLLSSVIGPGQVLPFKDKQLILGSWQRVVLVEFAGPRDREMVVSFL